MTTARHEMRTDTSAAIAYGPRMSRPLLAIAAALALVLFGMPAAADDEPRFHRTTPRGFFERDGEALVVGVPAGRAWGIESDLLPIPSSGALRVSLEVSDPAVREAFVRVGPSGCGKTTALRMLAGLEEQTSGDIFIGERIVNDVAPKDRDIAMVFQNYALYPHMSVYDNMAFGLKLRGMPKAEIERRVNEVGKLLGLSQLLKRTPKELSGGQRQRVAVGPAIAREPAVFLMDEPLSNLDAKLRIQTRAMLQKLHQRIRRTTIYVTHDQVEAMTMGDRIAVMNAGELQQLDTPESLHERPANLFVAGFIGSPSMNFFPAKVTGSNGQVVADAGFFKAPLSGKAAEAVGRDVILGIRPEDINDMATERQDGQLPLDAKVEVVEFLGNELQLLLSADTTNFIARVGTQTQTKPGQTLRVGLNLKKLHVFDKQTEAALR